MKDLDFDELDRAVNSLMSNGQYKQSPKPPQDEDTTVLELKVSDDAKIKEFTQPQPEPEAAPVAPVLESASASADSPSSNLSTAASTPAQEPAPVAEKAKGSQVVSTPRRSGRFMDIKSNAQARTSERSQAGPPSPRPNRLGGRLEPVSADVSMASQAAAPISQEASLSGVAAPAEDQPSGDDERPYSPFVPNVQLEKRPLGAHQLETSEASAPALDSLTVDDPEAQLPPQAEDQLPAELQSDLMSIESGVATEPAAEESAPVSQPTPAVQPSQPTATPVRPEMASIPPQYKAAQSKSDDAEGDVFGTESYHQPLNHPGKKKSGWWTVLLIVLLIVLGVAGGALVYLYVL